MRAQSTLPPLIGLAGKAGSGKDVVGRWLQMKYGYSRLAFADPVRQMAQMLFNIPATHVVDRALKEQPLPEWDGLSPRRIMQLLGTEVGRAIHADVWVKAAVRRMEAGKKYVITDVRFPNELAEIRKRGGEVWWVERSQTTPVPDHASERGVVRADCDIAVENNGTLDNLYDAIDSLCAAARECEEEVVQEASHV